MFKQSFHIFALVILVHIVSSCSKDPIEGSGTITTETINIDSFTGIRVEGVSDVYINYGPEQAVEATGHPNIISRIQTDVVNGVWQVELESGNYGEYELTYYITLPAINRVTSIGTGDVIISDFIDQPEIQISLEGTGQYQGFELIIEDCTVDILGSGDCEVTVNNSLDVTIEGSGNLYYKGAPTIKQDITGSGSIVDSN